MTSTATDPAKPARWIASHNENLGYICRLRLANSDIDMIIYEDKNNKWTCWFGPIGTFFHLENATTPEEAIAEAVVAITQRLAQLSADLLSIPLTFQP